MSLPSHSSHADDYSHILLRLKLKQLWVGKPSVIASKSWRRFYLPYDHNHTLFLVPIRGLLQGQKAGTKGRRVGFLDWKIRAMINLGFLILSNNMIGLKCQNNFHAVIFESWFMSWWPLCEWVKKPLLLCCRDLSSKHSKLHKTRIKGLLPTWNMY